MTLNTLEHRYVAEIYRMLEELVGLMTELAFMLVGETTEVYRMLKRTSFHILLRRGGGIVNHRVADIAVVGNHLAGVADVLAIMTTEATREDQMTDVVRMRPPIRFHLRKEIGLKDALHFRDGAIDR